MTKTLTTEQIRRVKSALAETARKLAKELAYSADLQHADMVAFYRGHIAKLEAMLAAGEWNAPYSA